MSIYRNALATPFRASSIFSRRTPTTVSYRTQASPATFLSALHTVRFRMASESSSTGPDDDVGPLLLRNRLAESRSPYVSHPACPSRGRAQSFTLLEPSSWVMPLADRFRRALRLGPRSRRQPGRVAELERRDDSVGKEVQPLDLLEHRIRCVSLYDFLPCRHRGSWIGKRGGQDC